jgi:hypothetical protein
VSIKGRKNSGRRGKYFLSAYAQKRPVYRLFDAIWQSQQDDYEKF